MMLDRLNVDRGGDMGLAGARPADQHDVVSAVDVRSPRQAAWTQHWVQEVTGKDRLRRSIFPSGTLPAN